MPDGWFPNASPVIVLAKIGRLGLMADLAEEILLPDAVVVSAALHQAGEQ